MDVPQTVDYPTGLLLLRAVVAADQDHLLFVAAGLLQEIELVHLLIPDLEMEIKTRFLNPLPVQ